VDFNTKEEFKITFSLWLGKMRGFIFYSILGLFIEGLGIIGAFFNSASQIALSKQQIRLFLLKSNWLTLGIVGNNYVNYMNPYLGLFTPQIKSSLFSKSLNGLIRIFPIRRHFIIAKALWMRSWIGLECTFSNQEEDGEKLI